MCSSDLLTAVTNTSLLCNMSNAGITDSAMMNDFITVGSAQVSTVTKKYGSGSLYFNGSTSNLYTVTKPSLIFGTSTFTIEMWINSGANGTGTRAMGNGANGSWASGNWVFTTSSGYNSNKFIFDCYNYAASGDMLVSTTASNDSAWHHITIVRNGNTWTMYVDGNSQSTVTSSVSLDNGSSWPLSIGWDGISGDGYWAGYMDDLRITKGFARYTANFTPPTSQFLTQ